MYRISSCLRFLGFKRVALFFLYILEPQCKPMERPCSGQAEPVLRGEPQRVRLGAHHHTPRALIPLIKLHMMMMKTMMKRKVMELSFSCWGCQAFSASLFWIKRLWAATPHTHAPTTPFLLLQELDLPVHSGSARWFWITLRKGGSS